MQLIAEYKKADPDVADKYNVLAEIDEFSVAAQDQDGDGVWQADLKLMSAGVELGQLQVSIDFYYLEDEGDDN